MEEKALGGARLKLQERGSNWGGKDPRRHPFCRVVLQSGSVLGMEGMGEEVRRHKS